MSIFEEIKTPEKKEPVYSVENWKEEDFDAMECLNKLKGPFIELAGPTEKGYRLIDIKKLPKKLHITNIYPGCPIFKEGVDGIAGFDGEVDFICDAAKTPFKDESIGAIFTSCLSEIKVDKKDLNLVQDTQRLREKAMHEIWRILEPGGLLVWQGGMEYDLDKAKEIGFKLVQMQKEIYDHGDRQETMFHYIFEKEEK